MGVEIEQQNLCINPPLLAPVTPFFLHLLALFCICSDEITAGCIRGSGSGGLARNAEKRRGEAAVVVAVGTHALHEVNPAALAAVK